MIGGIDIILSVPANDSTADLIIRRVRQYWPNGIFQDANSSEMYSVFDPWVAIHGTNSREFFIYRDAEAAKGWEAEGAVSENFNTMLHILLDPSPDADAKMQEITIVCDERTESVMSLIRDLEVTLCPIRSRLAA